MRHLFVTVDYPPDLGGMARRHVELCRRLAHEGLTVSTVAAANARAFDAAEPYNIARERFTFSGARQVLNRWRWSRGIVQRASQADVIHCANVRPCGYAVLLARRRRRARLPYIVYVNGGDLLRERRRSASSPVKRSFARRLFAGAAGIVANSAWTAETAWALCHSLGVEARDRIVAIDLGTDPRQFCPDNDRGSLREQLGWRDACIVLTVARLVPHKGHDVAFRAIAGIAGDAPQVRYLVIGEGPNEPVLRQLARQLGISDRVAFASGLSDSAVAEAYATADIYLGLSRLEGLDVEGFGIAFIEASASGLPVIAGDSGGVRSAVRDGSTGLLVPPQSVAAAAAALSALVRDAVQRRRLGEAGRRAVETHYNWDRVARETAAFVERVAARAR